MECIYASAYADWTTLVHTGIHGAETQFFLPIISIARVRMVVVHCTRKSARPNPWQLTKMGWVQMVSPCQLVAQPRGLAPRRGVVPLCTCQCASDQTTCVGKPFRVTVQVYVPISLGPFLLGGTLSGTTQGAYVCGFRLDRRRILNTCIN